ncbi:MAG: SpoIID/LytB domain-containing protein [Clostridia bacterium]|nr:SpoIID/LytB domain-containing protein [Clostridia bacterium]
MKQVIRTALLVAALLLTLVGASAASAASDRVRVLISTGDKDTLTFTLKGGYTLMGYPLSDEKVTFSVSDGLLVAESARHGEICRTGNAVELKRTVTDVPGGYATFKANGFTRNYLGDFTVSANNGAVRVVNSVPLRHYLYGVVGYEMSNSFPLEALKTQAIAAKNYALALMGKSGDYDLKDDATDQVYKGYVKTLRNVIRAVDETIGVALYLDGKIMPCWYSASNGGYSKLPGENWSSKAYDAGYFKGADPFDLRNVASKTEALYLPKDLARRSFASPEFYNFVMGKLNAALEKEKLPAGATFAGWARLENVVSTGEDGTITRDGDHSRVVLTAVYKIKTNAKRATPSPVPEGAKAERKKDPGTEERRVAAEFTFDELKEAGFFNEKSLRITYVRRAENGWSLFRGRYGHGVGMSQRGAQQMAREGWNFRQILAFYYPGATLADIEVTIDPEGGSALTELDVCVFGTGVLRKRASAASEVVGSVSAGSRLELLRTDGTWYYVRESATGREGYLLYNNIAIDGDPVRCTGSVTGTGVNVRTGPGTGWDAVAKLDFGDTVSVLDITASFYKVYAGGGLVGYMSKDYLALKTAANIPVQLTVSEVTPVPENIAPTPVPIGLAAPTPTPDPVMNKQGDGRYLAIGVAEDEETDLLAGPALGAEHTGVLTAGDRLGVYGKSGAFYRVQDLSTAREGWVYAARVRLLRSGTAGGYQNLFGCTVRAESAVLTEEKRAESAVVAKLQKGAELTVTAAEGLWFFAADEEGNEGWIRIEQVTAGDETVPDGSTAAVVREDTALRAGNKDSAKRLGRLKAGERVTVLAVGNGRAKVESGKLTGWCLFTDLVME